MARKTIITLHGAGMSAAVWDGLKKRLPCEAFTLPGHKQGDQAALLPSIEGIAAWTALQIKDYPPQSVILTGHSMGALVALEMAGHPAVAALVFLGAAAKMPVHADLLKRAQENPSVAADMILKWGISSACPQAEEIRATLKKQMQAVPAEAIFNDLSACNTYTGGEAAARRVKKPVLVISGVDDKMTSLADSKAMSDLIHGATFHALSGCGHMIMAEKPAETTALISSLMRS